jgi:hypothetical protein
VFRPVACRSMSTNTGIVAQAGKGEDRSIVVNYLAKASDGTATHRHIARGRSCPSDGYGRLVIGRRQRAAKKTPAWRTKQTWTITL